MSTLTPKQAEIRSRESRILSVARPLVAKSGIAGISMQAIARKMRYTKGTIYNHFSCKEEILLALAIQATETRIALFNCAQASQVRSRDRMVAICIACEDFSTRFEDLFSVEAMVRHATVWEKASAARREILINCEARCMKLVAGITRDAVRERDLKLPRDQRVEDLVFGLWSLSYGGMTIDATSPGLSRIGVRDTFAAIRRNCNAMMDGFSWQPLYNAAQHRKVVNRTRSILVREVPSAITTQADAAPPAETST